MIGWKWRGKEEENRDKRETNAFLSRKTTIMVLQSALTWAFIPESPLTLYFFLLGMTASPAAPGRRSLRSRECPPIYSRQPHPDPADPARSGFTGGGGKERGREGGRGNQLDFQTLLLFFFSFLAGKDPRT